MLLRCQELHKLENNFDGLEYLHILRGKNEVTDELAFQKHLAKATKVVESSQETPPPSESITESPEVMKIHLDWHTVLMIYFRIGGLPEGKVNRE
jgi:hypothetical protein